MPCYIRAAERLRVEMPVKVNEEKLERILMRELKVPMGKHELLRKAIDKKMAEDPEGLRKLLIQAIALAGQKQEKKKEEKAPPDRLKKLITQGDRVLTRTAAE